MLNPATWRDERFQLALILGEQASELSRRLQPKLGGHFQTKPDSSPVTVADLSVQLLVALTLADKFPDDVLIAEETAESLLHEGTVHAMLEVVTPYVGDRTVPEIIECFKPRDINRGEAQWILDPIDGTKGFLRGDQFSTALAYCEMGQVKFGILACPRLGAKGTEAGDGVLGAAYRDKGAWQKERSSSQDWTQLNVSMQTDVHQARLLRSFEGGHTNEEKLESLVEVLKFSHEPIGIDSQAKYLLLARGDAELVVRFLSLTQPQYKEKVWDQAAGSLFVTEAGGKISDLRGEGLDFSQGHTLEKNVGVLATNGRLHFEVLECLQVL